MLQILRKPERENVWEFLAWMQEGYFRTQTELDGKLYENAIVATGSPYFLQIPSEEFKRQYAKGSIEDVLDHDSYCNKVGQPIGDWFDQMYYSPHIGKADVVVHGKDVPLKFSGVSLERSVVGTLSLE